MDYEKLKIELAAGHPGTGVYSADASLVGGESGEINIANRTINRSSLSGDEVFTATDSTEFAALTDHKQAVWVSFCAKNIDPFSAANIAFVTWVFGAGITVNNLTALRTYTGSRAEELGFGNVREGDVEYARSL